MGTRRWLRSSVFIILLAPVVTLGCGGVGAFFSGSSGNVASLEVFPAEYTVPTGYSIQYSSTATYRDSGKKDVTDEASWITDNPSIAIAEGNGVIKGYRPGSTLVKVTYGDVTHSFSVTVSDAVLTSIQVTPINPRFISGASRQFTAMGIFSDSTKLNLTNQASWSSNDTNTAEISDVNGSRGLATIINSGMTRITASLDGISGETLVTADLSNLISIQITPVNPISPRGFTRKLKATGLYENNTTMDLTSRVKWSSASTSTAAVGDDPASKGIVQTKSSGRTVITASLDGVMGSTMFTVTSADLVSIQITPANGIKPLGLTERFTATGIYSDGTSQNITSDVLWSAVSPDADKPIVTISNQKGHEGMAKGIRPGSAVIKAVAVLDGIFFDSKIEGSMRFTVR